MISFNFVFSQSASFVHYVYQTKTIFLTRQRQLKKSPTPIKTIEFRVFGTRLVDQQKNKFGRKEKTVRDISTVDDKGK